MEDVRIAAFVVQDGRSGFHRFFGVENGRQDLVLQVETAATFFGGSFSFGDDGGDALTDEARHVIEHVRIVGVDTIVFVNSRRVKAAWHVFPSEHIHDARHGHGFGPVDRQNFGVRVRRSQHLEVQQALHRRYVARVSRVPRDDVAGERIGNARAARRAGLVGSDVLFAGECVANRSVPGAAAKIPLQRAGQVVFLLVAERGAVIIIPAAQ